MEPFPYHALYTSNINQSAIADYFTEFFSYVIIKLLFLVSVQMAHIPVRQNGCVV